MIFQTAGCSGRVDARRAPTTVFYPHASKLSRHTPITLPPLVPSIRLAPHISCQASLGACLTVGPSQI